MLKLLTSLCLLVIICNVSEASKSRAIQNFYCEEILNKQIKTEFDAAFVYQSLANYFSSDLVALNGFAKKFEESYKEEVEHATGLRNYLIKRGGTVETPEVSAPSQKWDDKNVCKIIEEVLKLEKSVHNELLKVHACGRGDSVKPVDPHLQDFIEDYLKEQVEANKELADLLTKLERTTRHINSDGTVVYLCDGLGLHQIDREL